MMSEKDLALIGKALIDIARDVMVVVQEDKVVLANQAAARIAGVPVEELIGTDFVDFLPLEDRERLLATARELQGHQGAASLIETRVVARDGSIHDLEASTTTISYRNQPAFLVIARDVTTRRQAEEQLKFSEERYRFLFQHVAEGLLLQEMYPDGSPGRYVEANQAVCQTLGYTREEMLELDLTDFATPELVEKLPEIGTSLLKTGHAHFEAEYFSKNGQRIPCEVFLHALELQGKKYVLSNARDLRERQRAQSELRSSERRYHMVLESANDAIMVHEIDEDGMPGKFVEVNRFACEESGYTREEMLELTPLDLSRMAPEELNKLPDILDESRRTTILSEVFTKDGRLLPVEVSAHLFDLDGKKLVVSVARDISERKEAETKLRRAKEAAEKANQAKTAFLANVSHELRTPLGGVLGLTELLLDRPLQPEVLDAIRKIHSSAEDLQMLIEDLLDLSVIEASKPHIKKAPFKLAATAEDIIYLLQERFREKGLKLELKTDSRLPATLIGDRTRIRQLLGNLLDNALKFTLQGGVRVTVDLQDSDSGTAKVRFSVEDSGIGVPPEERDAVFEKFVRLDNPINRKMGGTGLGLAICKQLVDQMNGRLGLEPVPGGGSRFWFSLRLSIDNTPRMNGLSTHELNQLKVLVVEDNQIGRELAVTMLKKLGCEPEEAENGRQALEMAKVGYFPMILMDLRMPDMDGLETTSAIRRLPQVSGRQPMIIAMTAQSLEEDRKLCMATGMDEFLSKPFTVDDLRSVMLRCIRTGR